MMSEEINPIYSGKPEDFAWVGFGSGSGTNLRECAKVIKPVIVFSDKPSAKLLNLEELADVRKIVLNGYEICGPAKEPGYEEKSEEYNEMIVKKLRQVEEDIGKGIDLIVLGGYMRIVKPVILNAYPDKVVNVHPAKLYLLADGERIFVGENAVYDAIKAGQTDTASSVIIVDQGIDHGEILTTGPDVKVWAEYLKGIPAEQAECLEEYADAHQSLQKVRSDWPALTTALKMISEGRIALGTEKVHNNEWRSVFFDGREMPYQGFKVKEGEK